MATTHPLFALLLSVSDSESDVSAHCSVRAVSEVRLTSWDQLPSGAALVDDAMSVASDDLSVVSATSSAESQSGPQQYLFQKQGCYAVARFLERHGVSVLRRVVLDE